jgi:hypothetical protein
MQPTYRKKTPARKSSEEGYVKSATILTTSRRDLTYEERAGLRPDTVLRDILAAKKGGNLAMEDIKDWAAQAFAELNGWRWAPDAWFTPEDLGKRGNTYKHRGAFSWGDHPLFFRAPHPAYKQGWVNVAIVGQPYQWRGWVEDELRELHRSGYGVCLPPKPRASFHLPGATLFIVVTQRPRCVEFLPEQYGEDDSVLSSRDPVGDWQAGR